MGRSCLKFLMASSVMGALTYGFINVPGLYAGARPQRALALTVAIVLATGVYFMVAKLLRARELAEMGGIFGRSTE